MSNVTYLSGWDASLCFQMNDGENRRCDLNRLLFKGYPRTEHIQQGKPVESAHRDGVILQFKERFRERLEEGASHSTLYDHYRALSLYLKWCDKNDIEAFLRHSIEAYMASCFEKVRLGLLKAATYTLTLSMISRLFQNYFDYPSHWFLNIPTMGRKDTESFEAYSRSDLRQLLPFLRKLFNQTTAQFLENPQKHINAGKCVSTMTFSWLDKEYKLCGAISKMMCAATYLMSYYTYSNASVIFQLKRPKNVSISVGEQWYQMPAFKRRSFKRVHLEMGGHNNLDIPKYSLSFFDKLLEVSKVLDSSDDALLLQTIANKKLQPVKSVTLQDFTSKWLEKYFCFTDQTGRTLRPIISRFRETGAQLTTAYQGELVNDITLGNTPQTRRKHYSNGNKHNNNGMMQDVAVIRQEQAQTKQGAKSARLALGIEVLTIEEEFKMNFPLLSRTPNGGSCANPFGEKSKAYNRKAKHLNPLKNGEKLACADLLKCFGCSEQVIVQSVSDIWCLLSFKASIEESLYQHLNAHHYRQNFENVIAYIQENILPKIKKNILKQAEKTLNNEGLHPLWLENNAILDLIPTTLTRPAKE